MDPSETAAQRDKNLQDYLIDLYGLDAGREAWQRLSEGLSQFTGNPVRDGIPIQTAGLTERDALLITYPDQVTTPGRMPLGTLADFGEQYFTGLVTALHILPFYPSSSDDGFAVIDYTTVDPGLGTWDDVTRLARRYRLMVDAVINHVSSRSLWFREFLDGNPRHRDYCIAVPPDADLTRVVRPRALPLLTHFTTKQGDVAIWTTFSPDQVDLNYHSPDVLIDIVNVLLFYVSRGAQWIRLDAIAYLWKETGTTCIHLPQTHTIIRLFRAILDAVAPYVILITETNVPHQDNLSYFGRGGDEAQMVYNFALPPLVLHTLLTGDATALSSWASGLRLPVGRVTFLNFLASHDGIGLNPVRGILPGVAIEALVAATQAHGGLVSSKTDTGGSQSPYELNISYFDALSDPDANEPLALQVDRFMAAQAILLSIVGVPAIYFHSLFGSRNWTGGVRQTGRYRTINRQKLDRAALEAELADPASLRSQVYRRYARLLKARAAAPAFDPYGSQQAIPAGQAVFGLLRTSAGGDSRAICLVNVTPAPQSAEIDLAGLGLRQKEWTDLIRGSRFVLNPAASIPLDPYQALWLT